MTPRRSSSPGGIFISYRSEDSKASALALRDKLVDAFGPESVFLDKDSLLAGEFPAQLVAAIDRSRVFLAVIGPRWLTIADEQGRRRLDQADDIHRIEIAHALSHRDITVIPVRIEGAQQPRQGELPPELRPLLQLQFRELSDNQRRRELDLAALIADIERATGRKAAPFLLGRHSSVRPIAEFLRHSVTTVLVIACVTFVVTLAIQVVAERLGFHWYANVTAFVVLVTVIASRFLWRRARVQ